MKIINNSCLLIFKLSCVCITECFPIGLDETIQPESLYQVSLFISDSFRNKTSDQKIPLFQKYPNKVYSFGQKSHQQFCDNALKNLYSLQESLIVFYTVNSSEIEFFIDYLIPNLSVRQRPKCLIVYSSKNSINDEIVIIDALKYAWAKKFLDFSIIHNEWRRKNHQLVFRYVTTIHSVTLCMSKISITEALRYFRIS